MIQTKKRADGRYTKRIKLANGAPKDIYGYSEEEISKQIFQIRYEEKSGLVINDNTLMSEWVIQWFKTTKKNKVSHNRSNSYSNAINNHIIPAIGGMTLKEIKPMHIQSIINGISNKSSALHHEILITLRQTFEYAIENGLIQTNPAKNIKENGVETEEKTALTKEEISKIIKIVKDTRVEVFINIALYCGLRKGEILALTWNDIDFINKTITVSKSVYFINGTPFIGPPKSKAGYRTVPMPLQVHKLLCKRDKSNSIIVPTATGKLCSEGAYRRFWDIVITKLQKPTKIVLTNEEELRKNMAFAVTAHKLRHTYCTMLYNAGIDLKTACYLMGHSSIAVTAKIYTHLDQSHIKSASEKLSEYLSIQS